MHQSWISYASSDFCYVVDSHFKKWYPWCWQVKDATSKVKYHQNKWLFLRWVLIINLHLFVFRKLQHLTEKSWCPDDQGRDLVVIFWASAAWSLLGQYQLICSLHPLLWQWFVITFHTSSANPVYNMGNHETQPIECSQTII